MSQTCCQTEVKAASARGSNPLQKFAALLLRGYRFALSPLLGNNCRFYPSCSHYAETAILEYGFFHGSWLTIKRLSKCHPWHPGGIDLVPERDSNPNHKKPGTL